MRSATHLGHLVLASIILGGVASGQPADVATMGRGTTLTGFVGAAVDPNESAPLAGGSAGWRLTPRVAIEGSGLWIDRNDGATAFAASLNAELALGSHHTTTPFVQGGVGLYTARFTTVSTSIPEFYARRLQAHEGTTFTDPTLTGGGGVNIDISRRVALRPDVQAIVVMRSSHAFVSTAFRLHLVYHFEDHPVTPTRRGR